MNFLDKLNVILEVFDIAYSKDAMDGVYKTTTKNNNSIIYEYSFKDPNIEDNPVYDVKIIRSVLPAQMVGADEIASLNVQGLLTDSVCSISLSLRDLMPSYSLTNFGNASYVYGKMLACLFDFVDTVGMPGVIHFTSYDPKTVKTYQKLLNRVAKNNGYKYVAFASDYYLLDVIADKIEHNEHINKFNKQKVMSNKASGLYSVGVNLHNKGII